MSLRSDPLDELAIPDGTHVEEHDLVTDGDVVVGGQSTVEFGVRGGAVIAGERVTFGGDIEAEGDCRLDMWCDVDGNVLVGQDAYLGERVHVAGQLVVSGDLDIGDDVDIEEGFEANGWIVIRNPMPTIVFIVVYLQQLLRIGEEEEAADVVDALLDDERDHEPVVIPRSSSVSDDAWRVSTPASIGDDCRIHGNIRATSLDVGEATELFGSLRAKEGIRVGRDSVVHGDVTTRGGTVTIAPGVQVRGDVSCEDLRLHEDAEVEGAIRARGEMSFVSETPDAVAKSVDAGGDWDDLEDAVEPAATPWGDLEPAVCRVDAGEDSDEAAGATDTADRENGDRPARVAEAGPDDLAEVIAEAEGAAGGQD